MTHTVTKPELLVDGDDRFFRQVIHDSLAFSARLQAVRNGFGESIGLNGPAYSILIAIDHLEEEGEVGISRVSDHLHLSGAFVTIEVNKLVKSGLVTKSPHPEDGRRVVLGVTEAGRARLEELVESQQSINDAIFADLSADDFQSFAKIISSLVGGTKEALALQQLYSEQRRRQA